MKIFRWSMFAILLTVSFSNAFAVTPLDENTMADKALVIDGHRVHNVGNLESHVTNWGLIGSRYSNPSTYSDAPSAMWPAGSGMEYLWGAGLWVGGTVLGEELVSTAFYTNEIMPTTALADTIFSTFQGSIGGNRFPWRNADDDGDGLEDEDPLDGIDNDNDGWIDEDYTAISDQEFRCTMADNSPLAIQNNPNHTPLNISVTQRSFQWADPLADDFIGYEYTIKNIGVTSINNVYCGMFSDFDIGPRGISNARDDMAGSFSGEVRASDTSFVTVSVAYMYDAAETYQVPGYAGWVMCGLETDAAAGLPENPNSLNTMQIYSGSMPFDQGGDPANDSERYEVMSSGEWDSATHRVDDYRVAISSHGISVLQPGESVTFRVALVLGAGLPEMLGNAAEAVLTAKGKYYDRDGEAANGAEYHVPWLRPDEMTPVLPSLSQKAILHEAAPNPFNPLTTISFELPRETKVSLRIYDLAGRLVDVLLENETAPKGLNKAIWRGNDLTGSEVSAGVYFYSLESATFKESKRMTLIK